MPETSFNSVAIEIDRIDRLSDQQAISEAKGRIASILSLPLAQVDDYIEKFKSTPAGRNAIASLAAGIK